MGFNGTNSHRQNILEGNEGNNEHHSFVLITCEKPVDGEMKVAMTYQGDPTLISCMLHDAQNIIDQKENEL